MSFVGLLLLGKRAKDMVVALFRFMGWCYSENGLVVKPSCNFPPSHAHNGIAFGKLVLEEYKTCALGKMQDVRNMASINPYAEEKEHFLLVYDALMALPTQFC